MINRGSNHGGVSVYAGVGERTREGTDLSSRWAGRHGRLRPVGARQGGLTFGQMDEPPGVRFRCLSALTMAEYFRDEQGQDVLFHRCNIFRFT